MKETLKDASRRAFTVHSAGNPTHDEIRTGAAQRVADSAEGMATVHEKLRRDRDYWQNLYNGEYRERRRLERSSAALRGVITRMKKRPRLPI